MRDPRRPTTEVSGGETCRRDVGQVEYRCTKRWLGSMMSTNEVDVGQGSRQKEMEHRDVPMWGEEKEKRRTEGAGEGEFISPPRNHAIPTQGWRRQNRWCQSVHRPSYDCLEALAAMCRCLDRQIRRRAPPGFRQTPPRMGPKPAAIDAADQALQPHLLRSRRRLWDAACITAVGFSPDLGVASPQSPPSQPVWFAPLKYGLTADRPRRHRG